VIFLGFARFVRLPLYSSLVVAVDVSVRVCRMIIAVCSCVVRVFLV
jgi:hypothetical protein